MSTTWHSHESEDGILRVQIDRRDRPVNVLSRAALEELAQLIERIRENSAIKGVLFFSSKRGNFIAGADVTELRSVPGVEAARAFSEFGQKVFQDLEDLAVPTVALISGACVGGGLEFAIACRYRIADDSDKTLLGLPEVKLGLIPGWGGTVRLPRLIGLAAALPMILTGKMLNGRQSRSKGLVHDVVPTEALDSVGEKILFAAQQESKSSLGGNPVSGKNRISRSAVASLFRPPRKPAWKRWMERTRVFQKIALRQAERQVRQKTHGHYPAPLVAIEVLRSSLLGRRPLARGGFEVESEAVAKLAEHPVTRELIRLFFLNEAAKKPGFSENPDFLKAVRPDTTSQAAVIGAGPMGTGIALLMAKRGVRTRLKDLKPEQVAGGLQTVRRLLNADVRRRRITPRQATAARDHLSPTTDYRGLKHADIVIEAVVEDLEIKRAVFRELAEATGPNTVLATNTSSLLVEEIAGDVPHPERVVGLHFFNPPHRMSLVEVVRTEQTSPQALATALALVGRLGKINVVVRDCAGFLVNRLLSPYMNEGGHLLAEVSDAMEIERAAVAFGMPMGPLELTDLVGLEVATHVANNLHKAYGDRMQPAPLWEQLPQMRAEGKAGQVKLVRQTKRGKRLDRWAVRYVADLRKEHGTSRRQTLSSETIVERLIYPVINEAARCLEERIVASPEEVDLAMVFGTGFAPFRGGPLRYADSVGLDRIVATLERLTPEHPRLAPSEALRRLAAEGTGFHESFQKRLSSVAR
jgi:3-hydroxyacyl-CoA dehydrogenase / enoyl-CoA hydratase / 3-hydroxybutyryl-CoA epimerase